MKRFSDETGRQAGARNFGRLALAMIPAALGGAALLWLSVAFGWIDLARMRRIDERTAATVGAEPLPAAPVTLRNHDAPCLKVESSFMDGRYIVFYVRNTCQRWLSYPNYSYRVNAPDGTVVDSGRWAFTGDLAIGPDERREQRVKIDADDRLASVDLYAVDGR